MYFVSVKFQLFFMKNLNYLLIIIGAVVAVYSKAGAEQNQYVLIGGIVMLMLGIYRISRNIPSRNEEEDSNENQDD